ncbi:MAG: hypothetical protein ORN49_06335 [Rhodobacteraceae bacterium]|nr:hypothetical protein [Paracoccaceae bacterium]
MSNQFAAGLAIVILLLLILDRIVFDGAAELFLARKFILLVDWLEFWR